MKLGQMNSETDINFKVDLLRQIMEECLEQITYADKEGFIGQKCAEMSTMAHKHMLQEQKLQTVNDQRLL